MTKETDFMIKSLFQKESMDEMTIDELKRHAEAFPYSSIIQFLYTSKLKSQNHLDFPKAVSNTALFFDNSSWLNYQLCKEAEMGNNKKNPVPQTNNDFEFPLTPYHTVDYFASLGIKINMEGGKDELSMKVKSFTAWLKTMKRLQPGAETVTIKDIQAILDTQNEKENQSEAVFTETMAEVYLKQGLREKAIEVYAKLSLQNPLNSHNFADKISQIKENKI
jgi:hypothetical protein